MILDLHDLEPGAELTADLCIVGAGIAGLSLAREFLDTRLQVVVVESGGAHGDGGANLLNAGEIAGRPFFSLEYGRTRGFGGTSELWAGQCTPLDRCDFAPRFWVPHSGWQIAWEDLGSYYRRANVVFALPEDTFADPARTPVPIARLGAAPDRLVPHVSVFSPRRYLGRELRDTLTGKNHVRALVNATLTRLAASENGARVDHAQVQSLHGQRATVRARTFVLACGALENARLLLASNRQESCGLGNRRDQVGRYL